jgi:signal transduction histidine kinase/ligand-binding sensor domain-containing protein
LGAVLLLSLAPSAQALDPKLTISQYIHDEWGPEDGFPGGSVNSIAETDGYLWIGAEKGLIRFDGNTFRLFDQSNTPELPSGPVLGLATDGDGGLWIRCVGPSLLRSGPNLLRYRRGKFERVVFPNDAAEDFVTAVGGGPKGDLILARPGGPFRYRGGKLDRIGGNLGLARGLSISVTETDDDSIWLGTPGTGLVRIRNGQETLITGLPNFKINCVLAGGGPKVWAGTDAGLVRWNGNEITRDGVPPPLQNHGRVLALARDRDSNTWVGTPEALFRINANGSYSVQRDDDRQAGPVNAIFEDREGDLWVGRARGIERFRESAFLSYTKIAGGPLFVDSEGRTWVGSAKGGLVWLNGTKTESLARTAFGEALSADVVYSIDGGPGELWVGRQKGGLTCLRPAGASFAANTYTPANGLAPGIVYAVRRNRDGTVWAGTLGGGVSRLRGSQITTYTTTSGLASNTIYAIEEGANGTMWFATSSGLSSLSRGHWSTYTGKEGLPPGRINCLTEDSGGILWIGTDSGPAFVRSDRVQTPPQLPESLLREIFGITDDGHGSLWIATSKTVVRCPRSYLLGATQGVGAFREFTPDDGIPGSEGVRRYRSVIKDGSGRIWFSLHGGVSVVDPIRLFRETVPAIVHIQSISADGNPVDMALPARIPAGRQRVGFRFTGLSMSAPERVRFRYRLDDLDHDWSQPLVTGEAAYTNLAPGYYRFRVMASNSEGLWSGTEAAVPVEVMPLFWQTWRFRIASALAFVLVCVTIHRIHLRQVTKQLNVRFEERLAERTRIAQDLHDTLLQGLLGASMQLHAVTEGVPAELPARSKLNAVLELLRRVTDEGRSAVNGLRTSHQSDSLENAFASFPEQQTAPSSTKFRVIVEGRRRPLNVLVRDEIYRIGREALVNSFRHAQASNVELKIEYFSRSLRLAVRDDGCGINAEVLESGRRGHWGLLGMRERARRIDGRLDILSREGEGTEVTLSVAGKIAFCRPPAPNESKFSWRSLWDRFRSAIRFPREGCDKS